MERNFWENNNFIQQVRFELPEGKEGKQYPFSIPAVRACREMNLEAPVTIFTGENGSGKSTILEAIAVAAGLNAEGGSQNFTFSTEASHSVLHEHTQLVRGIYRPKDSYFLRAESFYNVATDIDHMDRDVKRGPRLITSYGGVSLHHQSHGESFLALVENRFGGNGLYVFDEPEAALSPTNQLVLVRLICQLAERKSQFLISTHSPILLCIPGAQVYELSREEDPLRQVNYRETQLFRLYSGFLRSPERVMRELLK